MKDETFWIVVEEGALLSSGIRCDEGKEQAKQIRKKKTQLTGRSWKAIKTTQKAIDEEKRQLEPV